MAALGKSLKSWRTARIVILFVLTIIVVSGVVYITKEKVVSGHVFENIRELLKHNAADEEVEFVVVKNVNEFPHKEMRLPEDLVPLKYNLKIHVNLKALTFGGTVVIEILCKGKTPRIILHAKDIDIMGVLVRPPKKAQAEAELVVKRVVAFDEHQQLCIELEQAMEKGERYFVQLEFKAKISEKLEGLYKSIYYNSSQDQRVVAVTHFEPAHARQAFPCFDEPSMKATFTITIVHDPAYCALSNMPRVRTLERDDGLVEDHFAPSVKMSTYLVAFAVVDFDYKETITKNGVRIRVYVPPADYSYADYALHVASKVLTFYEELFDEPFKLPKIDLLGVPDFLNGAMENWGLVTFRLRCLVHDQRHTTIADKQRQTHIISHELAHQWFGNLVTMKWWSEIWLSEGFAKYLQYLGVDHVERDWHVSDHMVTETWLNAMKADSTWSTHAVVKPSTPEQNDAIFDAISYQKGATILRMVRSFLGEDNFLRGLKEYIQGHIFGIADSGTLWDAIAKADERRDLKTVMDPWIKQKSFPILSVRSCGKVFKVSQRSFLSHLKKPKKGSSEGSDVWSIPLSYITESTPEEIRWVWLPPHHGKHELKASTHGWLKANINATGYFVVNYDENNWKKLIDQLKLNHKVFTPADRANLIHDAFTLSCEGLLDPLVALNLSTYLTKETHTVPWTMMRGTAKCLMYAQVNKDARTIYQKFLWRLQDHLVDLVGQEDKEGTDVQRLFQYETLSEAIKYGQRPDVTATFRDLFLRLKDSSDGRNPVMSAEFRSLTFLYGANKSSDEDWHFLWEVYQKSTFDSDRTLLMGVLTSFNTDSIRQRNLRYSLDESKVRSQDSLFWLEKVNRGPAKAKDARWEFIRKHWDILRQRYSGSYKLGNLIHAVAGGFRTKHQLCEVKQFFKHVTPKEVDPEVQKDILEKIRKNMAKKPRLLKTHAADIATWLEEFLKRTDELNKL